MRNILIRADSSSDIGIGHIMRDLVLAKQFEKDNVCFATRNLKGNINDVIIENGFSLNILHTNEKKELIALIEKLEIDLVVIDHYEIDYDYEKQLKIKNPNLKIMVLDDTYERHFCDILLNHNIYADKNKYKELVPEYCELRCGSKYTLLREEFIVEKKKNLKQKKSEIKTIFIAMGGADHSNINIKILDVLKEFNDIMAIVVTTTANKNLKSLKEYSKNKKWIDLHINSRKIAHLMSISDFAIVTPSVTVNEVFFMEKPFIAIRTAENQKYVAEYLWKNNFFLIQGFSKGIFVRYLKFLLNIVELKLMNYKYLSLKEKLLVLELRNSEEIRKWMFNENKISQEEHFMFLDLLKNNSNREYFLVKSRNKNVGSINFKFISPETIEMGIFTNPAIKGIGYKLMYLICYKSFVEYSVSKIISEVFKDNIKAIKLYKKFNFEIIGERIKNNRKLYYMELTSVNWQP